MKFIKTCLFAVVALGLILSVTPAFAQYPKKPIKIIVPYGPGGQADLAARFLAKALAPYFPNISIVNMNSSGGVTGAAFVQNARPDGYTLLLGWISSVAISPAFYPEIPYSWDSFDHITVLQKHPFALAGSSASDVKTFAELENKLKTTDDDILFATLAPSTLNDVAPELMFSLMDVPMERARFVPFDSGANAVTALIGNHVDFLWQGTGPLIGAMKNKQINCLAVASKTRLQTMPECPTVSELGYADLEHITSWGSISGPKGLPQEVIDAWTEALAKVAKDPKWLEDIQTIEGLPAMYSPEEATAFIKSQYELFHELQEGKN